MSCQFLASERHNLHDDLCLIDRSVINFDEESQLNVLLYGWDEFNDKINKEIVLRIIPNRAEDTMVTEGTHGHPIFCVAKTKMGNKGKKERVSKQKLLKGCHQGANVTVTVLF